MHHSPAALDVVVGVARESAPRRLRQEKSDADPAVDADGSISKAGDGRLEIRPEPGQCGRVDDQVRTEAAPQCVVRKSDGLIEKLRGGIAGKRRL